MCTILVNEIVDRDPLRDYLAGQGIETRPAFYPIHTMPMFSEKYEKHSIAENIAWRGINLPSFPNLTEEEINYVIDNIEKYYKLKDEVS